MGIRSVDSEAPGTSMHSPHKLNPMNINPQTHEHQPPNPMNITPQSHEAQSGSESEAGLTPPDDRDPSPLSHTRGH